MGKANGYDVAVVGGGLVGTALAYELTTAGARVALIDRHDPGRATDAGAGILSPESMSQDDPSWFALAMGAGEHYRSLVPALEAGGARSTGYAVTGLLRVAFREWEDEMFTTNIGLARARCANEVEEVTPAEACRRFPPLGDMRAAWYSPSAARVDGRSMTAALLDAAVGGGVTRVDGSAEALQTAGGRVTGVVSGNDVFACDAVAIAGGAWTPEVADRLDVTVPVVPVRGEIVHLRLEGSTPAAGRSSPRCSASTSFRGRMAGSWWAGPWSPTPASTPVRLQRGCARCSPRCCDSRRVSARRRSSRSGPGSGRSAPTTRPCSVASPDGTTPTSAPATAPMGSCSVRTAHGSWPRSSRAARRPWTSQGSGRSGSVQTRVERSGTPSLHLVFADLLAHPGVTERVELRSRFGFMAIHGGSLERGTAEIATRAAGQADASLYTVVQPEDLRWHLPSHLVVPEGSPALAGFLEHVDHVVSIHGYGREGYWTRLLLGGQDRRLAARIGPVLSAGLDGYEIVDDLDAIPSPLRGLHPENPVNRTREGGVQLELPPRVRGLGPHGKPEHVDQLVAALARAAA